MQHIGAGMPTTSTTPPPPTKTGSGGFIVAAVVMLALMGGLIYWKLGGSDAPRQEAPKPIAKVQHEPVLEAPPPPPPPPEPEPAKPEQKVVKRVQAGGGGGCGGECTGTAPAALRSALMGKAGQARGCYERALRQNSMLQGRLVLNVRVGPQGQVCSATVASNGLGDPGVASCVTQMFRSSALPAPQGGCVDTAVPMNFVPKT
jgi:hypothetical protein